jgi:hypothetical protein
VLRLILRILDLPPINESRRKNRIVPINNDNLSVVYTSWNIVTDHIGDASTCLGQPRDDGDVMFDSIDRVVAEIVMIA